MRNGNEKSRDPWKSKPDEVATGENTELLRIPKGGTKNMICLSEKPIGRMTHYTGGRTMPCGEDHCEACDHEVQRRWYGWVTVYSQKSGRIALLEITDGSYVNIEKYLNQFNSMRGSILDAHRKGGRANGALYLQIKCPRNHDISLPKDIDRKAVLEKIWQTKRRGLDSYRSAKTEQKEADQLAIEKAPSPPIIEPTRGIFPKLSQSIRNASEAAAERRKKKA